MTNSTCSFGDDRLSAPLEQRADQLWLALCDRTAGTTWGPVPLVRVEVYDKAEFRVVTLKKSRIDLVQAVPDGPPPGTVLFKQVMNFAEAGAFLKKVRRGFRLRNGSGVRPVFGNSSRLGIYWREFSRRVRQFAPRFQLRQVPLPPVAGLAAHGLRNATATAKLFATLKKEKSS